MRSFLTLPVLTLTALAAGPIDLRTLVTAKEFAVNLTPSIRSGGSHIAYTVNEPRPGDNTCA